MSNKTKVLLYRKECLNCKVLVGELSEKKKKCSYKNGNELCPGKDTRLELYVPPVEEVVEPEDTLLSDFYSAIYQENPDSIIEVLKQIKEIPEKQTELFLDLCTRLFESPAETESEMSTSDSEDELEDEGEPEDAQSQLEDADASSDEDDDEEA